MEFLLALDGFGLYGVPPNGGALGEKPARRETILVKRAIQTFFKDPEPTENFQSIVPGINIIEGIAKIDEPMRSPVRGQGCVAYFYRSFLVMQSPRQPQPTIQKLKEAEVYAPFKLEMEGGAVEVIPAKPGKFTREMHQELGRQYGQKFQGVEEVILPGAKVRLKGKLKMVHGKPVLKMSIISVIDKQAVSAGVVGDRKKRRKKK